MNNKEFNAKEDLVMFVDASRNRSGGSVVYLRNFFNYFDFKKTRIKKIIICSNKNVLQELQDTKNIVHYSHSFLEKNLLFQIFWQLFILPCYLKKMKIDLLYTTDSSTFCIFKPSVVFNQDILAFDTNTLKKLPLNFSKVRLFLIKFIQIRAMNNANHIIFLSQFSKNFISNYLRQNLNYSIIPHGREYVEKKFVKSSWHFNNDITLLYVSPILKYKNHEIVVKSYENLKKKNKNLKIKFIGKIYDRKLYNELISKYKSINEKNFMGEIDHKEVKKYIKQSDIFIFASNSETFGITLLEAMTQGIPIICSNQSSLPEILEDGGLYFDPSSQIELSEKIDLLINDIILRKALSRKAMKISKKYSWEKNLNSFYKIINKNFDLNS